MKNIRLDRFLIEQGFLESADIAKKKIIAGWVKVNGETVRDPSRKISADNIILVERPGGEYVSRGGDKLSHALKEFKINLRGLTVLDIGASTGGFTDCELKSGAVKVYALDVGYNQLDYSLRVDPRVVVMEKIHAKDIKKEMFPDRIDFFTADLSFISILKILPVVYNTFNHIQGIVLVKPQFEAARSQLHKGIVVDIVEHREILVRVAAGIIESGFNIEDITWSPIKGHSGNIEFLFFLRSSDTPLSTAGSDPGNKNDIIDLINQKIYEVIESAHSKL